MVLGEIKWRDEYLSGKLAWHYMKCCDVRMMGKMITPVGGRGKTEFRGLCVLSSTRNLSKLLPRWHILEAILRRRNERKLSFTTRLFGRSHLKVDRVSHVPGIGDRGNAEAEAEAARSQRNA